MLALLVAAVSWRLFPLDEAWVRLARNAAAGDAAAFAVDRSEIVQLDQTKLTEWGAQKRESYSGPGYAVTTFSGPTRVPGGRWRSAYFAVVEPEKSLAPPSLWELTPILAPRGGATWLLQVSSCNLATGDPIEGHPLSWRTAGLADLPPYRDFKAKLAELAGTPRAFPADTTIAHTPGAICLYVGDMEVQRLLPAEALNHAFAGRSE